MITTIFIDIDNTLLDFGKCAKQSMKMCLKKRHLNFEPFMFDVFCKINDAIWVELENGKITQEELYAERWNRIFKELNMDINGKDFESDFLKALKICAEPVDYANEILSYLSTKYKIVAVSNGPHYQQIVRMKKANMDKYMYKLYTSEYVGYSKPTKEFFSFCFNDLKNISPSEVIVIGDSITADILGGIEYGLKTCWFNIKKSTLPENVIPDYIVYSLKEIEKIL